MRSVGRNEAKRSAFIPEGRRGGVGDVGGSGSHGGFIHVEHTQKNKRATLLCRFLHLSTTYLCMLLTISTCTVRPFLRRTFDDYLCEGHVTAIITHCISGDTFKCPCFPETEERESWLWRGKSLEGGDGSNHDRTNEWMCKACAGDGGGGGSSGWYRLCV